MRKEEMEEQFNKEAKLGWTFAADAARITDEMSELEVDGSGGGSSTDCENVTGRRMRTW